VVTSLDRSFAILLTNSVHPNRPLISINPKRRASARRFSGLGDNLDDALDAPPTPPEGQKKLRFEIWHDTRPDCESAAFEVSADGETAWRPPEGAVPRGFRWTLHRLVSRRVTGHQLRQGPTRGTVHPAPAIRHRRREQRPGHLVR